MESKADVLEMTSPLSPDTNTNQLDKVSELKETFESQKKWINILIRRRFPMQLIPPENIVDVAKKMKVKSFVGLMRSCKWVNAVITEKRSTFILNIKEVVIDYNKIKESQLPPENCQYYYFQTITFRNFENNVDELLAVLNSLNGTVLVTEVELINTVAIKELFLYLRPTNLTVRVSTSPPRFYCPITAVTRDTIPGYLKNIEVDLDDPSTVEVLQNVASHFVGKSQRLTIRASLRKISLDSLYDLLEVCMKNLAISRRKQLIFFALRDLIDMIPRPIMKFLESKAELSVVITLRRVFTCCQHWYPGLSHKDEMYSRGSFQSPEYQILHLFHKAEPGFVATKLSEVESSDTLTISADMKYCPTRYELREFAFDVYKNNGSERDDGNLRSLRDKIENHFSSSNIHDACYEPFENIEEQEFQRRPKQLEASELQLILDWKQKKPLPQLSWKLPVTEQVEQQLELLREAVDIQEQWVTLFKRGKFILKEIPLNFVLEIVKRMDTKSFVKALRTCKEIKKIIDYERPTFRKYVKKELSISHSDFHNIHRWVTSKLERRSYFRFMEIELYKYEKKTEILQTVISTLADRNILCDTLKLFKTVLTQEMVKSLRPKYINFSCDYYGGPQNYPEHVTKVCVVNKDSSRLIPTVEDLAGKHFQVEVRIWWEIHSEQDRQLFMQAIRCCIEKIKVRKSNGQFMFGYTSTDYRTKDINQEEISQGHDCFSYIRSTDNEKTFIFVAKAAGGVVAGVFSDKRRMFLWQFITTMKDFEELFAYGTTEDDRELQPEDEIAFSTVRSYFSQ